MTNLNLFLYNFDSNFVSKYKIYSQIYTKQKLRFVISTSEFSNVLFYGSHTIYTTRHLNRANHIWKVVKNLGCFESNQLNIYNDFCPTFGKLFLKTKKNKSNTDK